MTRLLRAELLKLATTRLLLWLTLLVLGLELLVISLNAGQSSEFDLAQASRQRDLVSFAAISVLISLILGMVSSAGEYAHGTVSHTFLATPARERVTAAKLVAVALAGAALTAVAEAVAYGLAALWLAGKSIPSELATRDTLLLLLGTLLAAALAGAIGVGFGFLVRRQTAAIVVALVWLMVGEQLIGIADAGRYAPGHAISSVVEAGNQGESLLGFWPGLAVTLAWTAGLALLGTLAVKGSDVT